MQQKFIRYVALPTMLALVLIFSRQAFTQESPLAQAAAKHQYALTWQDGRLTGAGAEFLLKEAQAAQFFLIGEDHGIAELPQLAAALFKAFQPYGYHRFVAETGPVTAQTIAALAAAPNPDRAFKEFLDKYPFALPFFSWREEAQLATTVVNTSPAKTAALWGVDQEFVLAPQFLFAKLAEMATDARVKAALQKLAADESAALQKVTAAKNPNAATTFMTAPTMPDLAAIEAHFKARKLTAALTILDELRTSRTVYQYFYTGKGYDNNIERARLLKRHFMGYYQRAVASGDKQPKLLLKMGAMHIKRGHSFLDVQDIGNLLAELAEINQTGSFHLFVVVAGGAQNGFNPFADESAKRAPIKPRSGAAFAALAPKADPQVWTLYDLRPLRATAGQLSGADNQLRELIRGYDAVLVIPAGTPASNF